MWEIPPASTGVPRSAADDKGQARRMARKKKTDSGAKKVDASHVKGLRAEVLEQPIVDT